MSYILEALKKSEQERGRGESPDVQTIHSSGLQYTRQDKPVWPYILAVVITLNVAAIIYFLIPVAGPADTSIIAESNNPAQPVAQYLEPQQTAPATTTQKQTNSHPTAIADSNHELIAQTQPRYTAPVVPPTDKHGTNAAKPIRAEVIDVQDLPIDIKTAIPEIVFSAHVYSSNPQQRSVVINNNFMEEGDALTSKLVLDEITSNGVIFEYEGTRFRSSVLSNWSTQ